MESLFNQLQKHKHKQQPLINTTRCRQSSVAIIFRGDIQTTTYKFNVADPLQIVTFTKMENLQILFIQRQHSARDAFSGEIAFPGGKCDGNESDLQAAIREVQEEVSLNLLELETYYVGRLKPNPFVRKTSTGEYLYCCAHIFVINDPHQSTDGVHLNSHEARAFKWVSLDTFINPQLTVKKTSKPYAPVPAIMEGYLAALDIGMDEVLYGLSFYLLTALFAKMRIIRGLDRVWRHGHYFKFKTKGRLSFVWELIANYMFRRGRVQIIDPQQNYQLLWLLVIVLIWVLICG